MEVIAWIDQIGLRRSSFPDFLDTVCELCQAELDFDPRASRSLISRA